MFLFVWRLSCFEFLYPFYTLPYFLVSNASLITVQRPPPRPPAYLQGPNGELVAVEGGGSGHAMKDFSKPPPRSPGPAKLSLITGRTPRDSQSKSSTPTSSPFSSMSPKSGPFSPMKLQGGGAFSPSSKPSGPVDSRHDTKLTPLKESGNIDGTEVDFDTGLPVYLSNVAPSKSGVTMSGNLSVYEKSKLAAIESGDSSILHAESGVTYERYDKKLSRYVDTKYVPAISRNVDEDEPVGPNNPLKALDDIWSACWDEQASAVYYYNNVTGEATWIHPSSSSTS